MPNYSIENLRVVLLTGPYGHNKSRETLAFCAQGRTVSMVEVTLGNGVTGLGEGYLGVFAPTLFAELVQFLQSRLLGKAADDVGARVREMRQACDYWGIQGPMRHAIAAIEIALVDACAKTRGVPAYVWLGGARTEALPLYGSGGDATTPDAMLADIEAVAELEIDVFKMRVSGGNGDVERTIWTLERGADRGIRVAADMSQNLGQPPQTAADALDYVTAVHAGTAHRLAFLEEAVGPFDLEGFRALRAAAATRIAGGETITSAEEMNQRIAAGVYDIAQPDASVMGLGSVAEVCAAARAHGCTAAVHAWGGPVGLMANYHIAFAAGGRLAEVPLLHYGLRDRMYVEPLQIKRGHLTPPLAPGFGVALDAGIEREFPFDPRAVYRTPGTLPPEDMTAWSARTSQPDRVQ